MAGLFDVSVAVITADGCSDSFQINDYINVSLQPTAYFVTNPSVLQVVDTEVDFINNSINAENYIWDFGDDTLNSSEENPTHTYPDIPGQGYTITLWAIGENPECIDSAYQFIQVDDILIYYVPNTFTPDGDEFNQTFKPIFTSGYDPYDFHMMIFNRWGEVIFETYDVKYGWNGYYANKVVQDGTYTWKIDFKETKTDKRHMITGHVNIIR